MQLQKIKHNFPQFLSISSITLFLYLAIAYACIAVCIVMMWDCFIGKNIAFESVGKASLAMYLVHIGVVDMIYLLDISTDMKTIIFVFVTSIGTIACHMITEHINRTILVRLKN